MSERREPESCSWRTNRLLRGAVLALSLLLTAGSMLPAQTQTQTGSSRSNQPAVAVQREAGPVRRVNQQAVPDRVQPPEVVVPEVLDQDGPLSPSSLGTSVKVLILLTLLSLAPSILMMTTSFVRFVIVLGLLRQALGTQSLPPTQVITALSVFLTMFVMTPVWQESYENGIAPYINNQPFADEKPGSDRQMLAVQNTFQPMRRFMSEQIHKAGGDDVVWMLIDFRRPDPNTSAGRAWQEPQTFDDVEWSVIVTSFLLTELKTAFLIGFQIYLPFVVIDMVVSVVLTGMGMVMLPPTLISLPFKLLLFVLIDGWTLTVQMLLRSVDGSFG